MRYLIDTNIFVYIALDPDYMSSEVASIVNDPTNLLYISAESVKELIVAYNNKRLGVKVWKTAEDMVRCIEEEFFIEILPIGKDVLRAYSHLQINKAQFHKDPSDHMIISHAIAAKMPLISSDTRFPYYRRQGLTLVVN